MQRQHTFILSSLADGHTILAYDRSAVPQKVHRIKTADRVKLVDGVLFVDGKCAMGWTIVRKPEVRK